MGCHDYYVFLWAHTLFVKQMELKDEPQKTGVTIPEYKER